MKTPKYKGVPMMWHGDLSKLPKQVRFWSIDAKSKVTTVLMYVRKAKPRRKVKHDPSKCQSCGWELERGGFCANCLGPTNEQEVAALVRLLEKGKVKQI